MSWQGKQVLVTGADGFIGSHLAERLAAQGANVRAFVLYNSLGHWGWLEHTPQDLKARIEVFAGDVRDAGRVSQAMAGCEVVFHLAALIAIPYSYHAPQSYVDTNVMGTLNVLNAALHQGKVKVVHTSTSEVYGTPADVPIRETHPLQPQSPYAASKVAADQLAYSYHCSFELPVVILRPFNTYGPRQSARAVIPTILTQLLAGESQIRLGALWPRRDLTYVDDTVAGFLAAAHAPEALGQTIQLGNGRDVSIGELAELAIAISGTAVRIVSEDQRLRPKHSEVERLLSDPGKAQQVLGWAPKVTLEEGLQRTAQWLKRHLAHYKVGHFQL